MSDKEQKLAGDELEEFLHKVGADQLADLYEEITDEDCGCEGRKEWINNKHQQLIDWWTAVKVWCAKWFM